MRSITSMFAVDTFVALSGPTASSKKGRRDKYGLSLRDYD